MPKARLRPPTGRRSTGPLRPSSGPVAGSGCWRDGRGRAAPWSPAPPRRERRSRPTRHRRRRHPSQAEAGASAEDAGPAGAAGTEPEEGTDRPGLRARRAPSRAGHTRLYPRPGPGWVHRVRGNPGAGGNAPHRRKPRETARQAPRRAAPQRPRRTAQRRCTAQPPPTGPRSTTPQTATDCRVRRGAPPRSRPWSRSRLRSPNRRPWSRLGRGGGPARRAGPAAT